VRRLHAPSECRIHVRYTHLDDVRHTAAAWRDPLATHIDHHDSTATFVGLVS
jgi:hypothetical protein